MDIDALQARAAELFPAAVRFGVAHPGAANPSLESLGQLVAASYNDLGFDCHADCFAAAVPKLKGHLALEAWCEADLIISGWPVNITMRPFHLGAAYVHFEIRHNGPLPGVTETGFRSDFLPLAKFAHSTPEEFLTELIPAATRSYQLNLF